MYEKNAFLTLTYSDKNLPPIPSDASRSLSNLPGTLIPEHAQLFMKRLRKSIEPQRVRFYLVGEYGDDTERPHYHAGLFNFQTCLRGKTKLKYGSFGPSDWKNCCDVCRMVGDRWGLGDVFLGGLGVESAQYLAQYVTKKMTSKDDSRLFGRHPEFARMSLRPGIGSAYMHEVASTILNFDLVSPQGDVPASLRLGSRMMPLGRFLRQKLRQYTGVQSYAYSKTPGAAPSITLHEHSIRMRLLQDVAWSLGLSVKEFSAAQAEKKVSTFNTRKKRKLL